MQTFGDLEAEAKGSEASPPEGGLRTCDTFGDFVGGHQSHSIAARRRLAKKGLLNFSNNFWAKISYHILLRKI
jgi:hypothetical protein|tara:strand:- start:1428 stop:1646 length:219 start_codon:yes stop_codon:yes gene_type:complete